MVEAEILAAINGMRAELSEALAIVRARYPEERIGIAEYARIKGLTRYAMGQPWNVPYFKMDGTRHPRATWDKWHSVPVATRREGWDLIPYAERVV